LAQLSGEHKLSPQMCCPPGNLSVFWENLSYTELGVSAFTAGNVAAKTIMVDNANATKPILICWLDIMSIYIPLVYLD
jgi:hypothetical protein